MAVFTEVSFDEASALLAKLDLGELQDLQGCVGGIENTNYFATTDRGAYVLTLFERLSFEQLPFYLHLMKHLAFKGIPVPDPATDRNGEILHQVLGKPAAVVNRLRGRCELDPSPAHCEAVGAMLARMHLAGLDYPRHQPNLRGLSWWNETVPLVLPHIQAHQAELLRSELAFQNHVAQEAAFEGLPRGPIHADLFRDNVMFDLAPEDGSPVLTGFFDFYFAGVDSWLFDLAVCLNDWCIDLASGAADLTRSSALLRAYQQVRPLQAAEQQLFAAMLRAGALRFWISRLWDFYLPRDAAVLQAHDPQHFERVLLNRVMHPLNCARLLEAVPA